MSDILLSTATVRQIDDLSKPYIKMKPKKYPIATLAQVSKGGPPKSIKSQWGEKSVFPLSATINNGAGYNDSATGFTVDATAGFQDGMDVINPRTLEVITLGTVASTTSWTGCTRGARGTVAAAILDNDVLIPMSIPRAENYAYSSVVPRMQQADEVFNYIHLFAEAVAISNTEQALQAHGGIAFGEKYDDHVQEAIENIKHAANRQILWGVRDDGPPRTAGGFMQFAAWKDFADKDITNRKTFEETFENPLTWADDDLLVGCSFTALQAFQYVGQGADPKNATGDIITVAGVEIQRIKHFLGGWLYLYRDPDLVDYIGADGLPRGIFNTWVKGALVQHDNRPIGRYKVPPTTDGLTEQVQLETTWSFEGAKRFGLFGGVLKPS